MRTPARPPRSARRAGACLALALALVLPGVASAADGGTATASAGAVQATFTWAAAQYGNKDPHLVVTRAGAPAFDATPVPAGSPCSEEGSGTPAAPGYIGRTRAVLSANHASLNPNGTRPSFWYTAWALVVRSPCSRPRAKLLRPLP